MNDAALIALEHAIKFESDGRDFYIRSAENMKNPLARLLLSQLADEELDHAKKIRAFYEKTKDNPGWSDVDTVLVNASGVLNIFEREFTPISPDASTKEALEKAADMEKKGIAFYSARMNEASGPAEKKFFKVLIGEEEKHLKAIEKVIKSLF